jgi:cell division initiation protein
MELTALEIRHKEFKRGVRGYVDHEVDEFLDDVTDEFERLTAQNTALTHRCADQEAELDRYRALEETLQRTLVSAQCSAKEVVADANQEARRLVSQAEREARAIVNQSYADKQVLESEIAVLGSLEEDLRFKFQSLLAGYLQQLDELDLAAQEWQRDPSSENAEAAAAEHTTDCGRSPTTLGDLIVAEPWRSALEPAIACAPAVATTSGAVRARAPIALLTATTGDALSSAQLVDEAAGASESTSSGQLESQPETRKPRLRLSRFALRRRRAVSPQNLEGDPDAHRTGDDDNFLAMASVGTVDESSDGAAG